MQIPAALLPHSIIVHPYLGTGPYGDVHGDPIVMHRTFVEDRRRLVRTPTGEDALSETIVRTRSHEHISIGSLVTVWAATPHERTGRVLTTNRYGHPLTWSHIEVALA